MKQFFTLLLAVLVSATLSAQLVEVTFAVDLEGQDADAAFVAGEFQGWTPADGALADDDGNGIWSRTYMLAPGTYLYKFGLGNDWGNNEGAGLADCGVDDNNGGFNRQITVEANTPMTVAFEYDSCEEVDEDPNGLVEVTFGVDLSAAAPDADAAFVAGEFQGWTPGDGALADDDGNGIWTRTYMLAPGTTFLYKFGIGSDWGNNEGAGLADCGEDDGNGGFNRSFTVPMDASSVDVAFVYDSCDEVDLTNVSNVSTITGVSLSPNPMTDVARVRFSNESNAVHNVRLSNMNGQVVREYPTVTGNSLVIERGALRSGLYFVTFRNDRGEVGSLKLMVN